MKKVLILEDEVSIRSFVVINLKRAGYEAIEAETGEEALAQLLERREISPQELLGIGVIGEYVGKIYNETKARPRFIISETTFEKEKP